MSVCTLRSKRLTVTTALGPVGFFDGFCHFSVVKLQKTMDRSTIFNGKTMGNHNFFMGKRWKITIFLWENDGKIHHFYSVNQLFYEWPGVQWICQI